MTKGIQYTVEWSIKDGKLDTFKNLAHQAIEKVQKNEPGMKGYQWYFNDDGSKCYTAEWLKDSDSLMAHLKNVGDVLPQLLEQSDITRFEVFGNPSPEAEAAVNQLGARVFHHFEGFARN